jgi:hypothetical protein
MYLNMSVVCGMRNARDVSEADSTPVIKYNVVPITQMYSNCSDIHVSAHSSQTHKTESEGVSAVCLRNVVCYWAHPRQWTLCM